MQVIYLPVWSFVFEQIAPEKPGMLDGKPDFRKIDFVKIEQLPEITPDIIGSLVIYIPFSYGKQEVGQTRRPFEYIGRYAIRRITQLLRNIGGIEYGYCALLVEEVEPERIDPSLLEEIKVKISDTIRDVETHRKIMQMPVPPNPPKRKLKPTRD
jgi:hypothetical protein